MSNYIYKTILPQSVRDSYGENENISFVLSFAGQRIKQGSLRLCGNLTVSNLGVTSVSYDALTGVHSLWSSVVVESEKRGVIENLQALPRYIHMQSETLRDDTDVLSNSDQTTSLTLARDDQTTKFLGGVVKRNDLPFSCKLQCCLNKSSGDISFARNGVITLSIRTASKNQFLTNAGATSEYSLSDVMLMYQTEPEKGGSAPVSASTYHMVKHTISSGSSSVQTRVPAVCESVSCSFVQAGRENSNDYNNNECSVLPGVSRVQWEFNDSMSMVKYDMTERDEILYNYIRSMGVSDFNNVRVNTLVNESKTYGIGLNFYAGVNLLKEKIGVDIISSVTNNTPYSMYMFFRSAVSL